MGKCLKFRHYMKVLQLVLVTGFCKMLPCHAQMIYRAPANYVPDDDMIVVPMVIERNKMDEFNERHKSKFKNGKILNEMD